MNTRDVPAYFCTAFVILLLHPLFLSAGTDHPHVDPTKVLGSESCVKCHQSEFDVWKKTPHYTTFRELHRTSQAKQIASKLGIRSIKRGGQCMKCHYTLKDHGSQVKAISGVSCESCHGASKDWIEIHNDYGGPHVTKDAESIQHRAFRRQESVKLGMCNPQNLYLIAKNCFHCHTTPDEQLVNVGGHPAGSADFELVSWSQGMIRHNYVRTDGKKNDVSSRERLRVMFVVGKLTDLEFSLRATALATQKSTFGVTSAKRADAMKKTLIRIQHKIKNPFVAQAINAVSRVRLKLNNKEELLQAAEEVSDAAYRFAEKARGSELAAIDGMLPKKAKY